MSEDAFKLEERIEHEAARGHHAAMADNVEQRRLERLMVRQEAELIAIGHGRLDRQPLQIYIQDVGLSGMGFICSKDLELNSLWHLSVVQHGHILSEQTIIIRHCQKLGEDKFIVG